MRLPSCSSAGRTIMLSIGQIWASRIIPSTVPRRVGLHNWPAQGADLGSSDLCVGCSSVLDWSGEPETPSRPGVLTLLIPVFLGAGLALFAQTAIKDEVQAHYRKAADAMRLRKLDEAAEEFRAILRLDPNLAEGHANLAGVYYIQRKYPEAAAEFEAALRLKPTLTKAEDLLGISEARSGHFEKALPLLEKTFKRPSENELRQEAGILLIELFKALLKPERARETLDTLRQAYPASPEVL